MCIDVKTMRIVYRYEDYANCVSFAHYSSKVYGRAIVYRNRSQGLKSCKLYYDDDDDDNDDDDDDDEGLCTID